MTSAHEQPETTIPPGAVTVRSLGAYLDAGTPEQQGATLEAHVRAVVGRDAPGLPIPPDGDLSLIGTALRHCAHDDGILYEAVRGGLPCIGDRHKKDHPLDVPLPAKGNLLCAECLDTDGAEGLIASTPAIFAEVDALLETAARTRGDFDRDADATPAIRRLATAGVLTGSAE